MLRAVRLVWTSSASWTSASTALIVVQSILPLIQLYLLKLIVDSVAHQLGAGEATAFPRIAWLLAFAAATALLAAVCRSIEGLVAEGQARAVSDHLHELVHTRATEIDLEYYGARATTIPCTAPSRRAYRPTRIVNGLCRWPRAPWRFCSWPACSCPSLGDRDRPVRRRRARGAARLRHARRSYDSQQSQTQAERRGQYYHAMLTGTAHAKELRLFGLGRSSGGATGTCAARSPATASSWLPGDSAPT
jgi:ATP-binding cassette subfamily B protein